MSRNRRNAGKLIAEFVSAEHDEMRAMLYRALRVVEHALSACKEYMTKEGDVFNGANRVIQSEACAPLGLLDTTAVC